ncbi:hypothetical protein QUF90_15215 [Desulfococcaceae bacterium HSG9]|nr:hypothetical protein [Desulfococcaceae bacterium HSG9]
MKKGFVCTSELAAFIFTIASILLISYCSWHDLKIGPVDDENWWYWSSINKSQFIDMSIINPVQSLGGASTPFCYWLNPAYIISDCLKNVINPFYISRLINLSLESITLLLLCLVIQLKTSTTVFVIISYAMLSIGASNKPNEFNIFGHLIAINILKSISMLWIVVFFADFPGKKNIIRSIIALLLIFFSVMLNPLYTPIYFLYPVIIVGVIIFSELAYEKNNAIKIEIGVYMFFILFFAMFYYSLVSGVARNDFPNEIYSEIQTFDYLNAMPFRGKDSTFLFFLVLLSIIFNISLDININRLRLHRAMFIVLIIIGGIGWMYTYSGLKWKYPSPVYLEQSILALILIEVLLCIELVLKKLNLKPPLLFAMLPYLLVAYLLFSPQIKSQTVNIMKTVFKKSTNMSSTSLKKPSREKPISGFLRKELALDLHDCYEGSVSLMIGMPDSPISKKIGFQKGERFQKKYIGVVPLYIRHFIDDQLYLTGMWKNFVPTLGDNSHMVSSFKYHFFSRLLSNKSDYQSRNWLVPTIFDSSIFALLGVKYLISDLELENSRIKKQFNYHSKLGEIHGYEVLNTNTGNFYPTDIIYYKTVNEVYRYIRTNEVDFTKTVFIHHTDKFDKVLSVGNTKIFGYPKTGVARFEAASSGSSLAVLPLEFSNALIAKGEGNFQIVRINLIMTGVLFKGNIQITMENGFGLMNLGGRIKDRKDMKKHGIYEDGYISYPDSYQPHQIF